MDSVPGTAQPRATTSRVTVRPSTAAPTPVKIASPAAGSTPARAGEKRPYWSFDRLLVVLGSSIVVLAPGLFASPAVYAFLGPQMVPSLIALGLILWKDRPWTFLTAAILGAVFPLMTVLMFGILGGALSDPVDISGFAAVTLIVVGLAFVEAGAISGFVHGRRKSTPTVVRAGWRTGRGIFAIMMASIFLGVLTTGSMAAGKAGDTYGYDITPDATLRMTTEEFAFKSKNPTADAGVLTEFVIENKDKERHTFTYILNGTVYNHEIYGGKTARFLAFFPEPGTVGFWCDPHSDGASDEDPDSMVGTLTVE